VKGCERETALLQLTENWEKSLQRTSAPLNGRREGSRKIEIKTILDYVGHWGGHAGHSKGNISSKEGKKDKPGVGGKLERAQ